MPDWEGVLRDVGECLRRADAASDVTIKAGHLNDAIRGLLGVVIALADSTLAKTPDPEIGLP